MELSEQMLTTFLGIVLTFLFFVVRLMQYLLIVFVFVPQFITVLAVFLIRFTQEFLVISSVSFFSFYLLSFILSLAALNDLKPFNNPHPSKTFTRKRNPVL